MRRADAGAEVVVCEVGATGRSNRRSSVFSGVEGRGCWGGTTRSVACPIGDAVGGVMGCRGIATAADGLTGGLAAVEAPLLCAVKGCGGGDGGAARCGGDDSTLLEYPRDDCVAAGLGGAAVKFDPVVV